MADFVGDFVEWVGPVETPDCYVRWAALALVGACLQRRVHVAFQLGNRVLPLVPNLYVLLLGPSGNGKSLAASAALQLLHSVPFEGLVTPYVGKMTAPAMYQRMFPGIPPGKEGHRPKYWHPERSLIWVVNDELANDIGMGEYADQFVKSLTRMYLGTEITDDTVTRGTVVIPEGYCVNWLACTTREWLHAVVHKDAILGGFFARTTVIESGYTGKKVPPGLPIPENHPLLERQLKAQVEQFLQLVGEITLHPTAAKLELDWYMARPKLEEGDPLAPTRQRERPLALKLATILAVAGGSPKVILPGHYSAALKLVEESSACIPSLAETAAITPANAAGHVVLKYLERKQMLTRSQLTKYAYTRGVDSRQLSVLTFTWVEAGLVDEVKDNDTDVTTYFWKGGKA